MIHHIGAVLLPEAADRLHATFTGLLGAELWVPPERVAVWSCTCWFYSFPARSLAVSTLFEIVVPEPDSPLMRWVDATRTSLAHAQTGGLHHVAFGVLSVEQAGQQWAAQGAPLLSPTPVQGAAGLRVNFVHPSWRGILIELVEDPFKSERGRSPWQL